MRGGNVNSKEGEEGGVRAGGALGGKENVAVVTYLLFIMK